MRLVCDAPVHLHHASRGGSEQGARLERGVAGFNRWLLSYQMGAYQMCNKCKPGDRCVIQGKSSSASVLLGGLFN